MADSISKKKIHVIHHYILISYKMKNHMILDICIHVRACINVHVCASVHTHISIWQNSTFIFDKKNLSKLGLEENVQSLIGHIEKIYS